MAYELAEPFETLLFDELTTAARERAAIIYQEWREIAQEWSPHAKADLVGPGVQPCRGFEFRNVGGRYRDRTCDLFRVREALSH